jgi:hypothetical protein
MTDANAGSEAGKEDWLQNTPRSFQVLFRFAEEKGLIRCFNRERPKRGKRHHRGLAWGHV